VLITVYEVLQLISCQTVIRSQIDISKAQCLDRARLLVFSSISITLGTLNDSICLVTIIYRLYHLRYPIARKVVAIALAASCLLGTVFGIPSLYYLAQTDWGISDVIRELISVFAWSMVQGGFIIITACLPVLQRAL